jgi:ParB-like chromosome segregation protein Spo0J
MEIENLPPESVRPYPENPRRNDAAINKVKRSLQDYGFRQPIVVDEEMVVIVGHTRLEAAKRLKLKTVPVHVARGLSPAQVRAYRIADNRTGEDAVWDDDKLRTELGLLKSEDFDLSGTGMTDDDLNRVLGDISDGFQDANETPEDPFADGNTRIRVGPYQVDVSASRLKQWLAMIREEARDDKKEIERLILQWLRFPD